MIFQNLSYSKGIYWNRGSMCITSGEAWIRQGKTYLGIRWGKGPGFGKRGLAIRFGTAIRPFITVGIDRDW